MQKFKLTTGNPKKSINIRTNLHSSLFLLYFIGLAKLEGDYKLWMERAGEWSLYSLDPY